MEWSRWLPRPRFRTNGSVSAGPGNLQLNPPDESIDLLTGVGSHILWVGNRRLGRCCALLMAHTVPGCDTCRFRIVLAEYGDFFELT